MANVLEVRKDIHLGKPDRLRCLRSAIVDCGRDIQLKKTAQTGPPHRCDVVHSSTTTLSRMNDSSPSSTDRCCGATVRCLTTSRRALVKPASSPSWAIRASVGTMTPAYAEFP